jgi:hypothetical protein
MRLANGLVALGIVASAACGPGHSGAGGAPTVDASHDVGVSAAGDAPDAAGNGDADASEGPDAAADTSDGAAIEDGDAGNAADASDGGCIPFVGAVEPGDRAPRCALNVTAPPGQHVHQIFSANVGLDNRAATMAGKLVVELGVDIGNYDPWLGKRGFHVFGVSVYHCAHEGQTMPYGRDYPTNCRLTVLDGQPRGGPENDANAAVTADNNVMAKIKKGLAMLQQQFPDEGWGYFLNDDGSVRWSDVGFTGFAYGGTNAAVYGHALRAYRIVSRSAPRDNTCGLGPARAIAPGVLPLSDFDPLDPPYKTPCDDSSVASWLDMPSQTPIERYFAFTGKADSQYGDHMFAMERMHYVGTPVNISTATPPYGGSHRFYADVGHTSFDPQSQPQFTDAINIAFGVLAENAAGKPVHCVPTDTSCL